MHGSSSPLKASGSMAVNIRRNSVGHTHVSTLAYWINSGGIAVVQNLSLHSLVATPSNPPGQLTQKCHYFCRCYLGLCVKKIGLVDMVDVEIWVVFRTFSGAVYVMTIVTRFCFEAMLALWKKMTLLQTDDQTGRVFPTTHYQESQC